MRSGALVITLVMLFSAFTSVAQNAKNREPNILESPDSSNVYYLYGSDGWGGVPKGWTIQDRYLKKANESDLERQLCTQGLLHTELWHIMRWRRREARDVTTSFLID